jgi:hypothetical protein
VLGTPDVKCQGVNEPIEEEWGWDGGGGRMKEETQTVKPITNGMKIRKLRKTEATYAYLLPSNSIPNCGIISAWIIHCAIFLSMIDVLT